MARKPKLDTVLAEAVDTARQALAEIAVDSEIGDYCGASVEGERLVTHRFISHRDGYRGWTWFVTLARIPRAKAKDATVCELGIIPGEDALLAPAWVPWADRLAQDEIDAAQREGEQTDTASDSPAVTEDALAADEPAGTEQPTGSEPAPAAAEEDVDSQEPEENPRRPVRRRRTAQRTAARRRAAARNRGGGSKE
ncbi:DUF3027 domain-containing protein [Glutamicibacter sp. MNS18]|uniref:DUF3027 domain-containing protein n=1 Tax=Glutamicibacter sp. MNS18 TaxID=2989817 RepID=UPI0022366ED6|nr:DUF3027 domain-containing protein [Glutamicibacter sp. MNS18]MCW4466491.1 DUF3027 domain-containing protein [Glutamicibacter sp. MNS18]